MRAFGRNLSRGDVQTVTVSDRGGAEGWVRVRRWSGLVPTPHVSVAQRYALGCGRLTRGKKVIQNNLRHFSFQKPLPTCIYTCMHKIFCIHTCVCSSGSGKAVMRLPEMQFGDTAVGVPQPTLPTLASEGRTAILRASALRVCLPTNVWESGKMRQLLNVPSHSLYCFAVLWPGAEPPGTVICCLWQSRSGERQKILPLSTNQHWIYRGKYLAQPRYCPAPCLLFPVFWSLLDLLPPGIVELEYTLGRKDVWIVFLLEQLAFIEMHLLSWTPEKHLALFLLYFPFLSLLHP